MSKKPHIGESFATLKDELLRRQDVRVEYEALANEFSFACADETPADREQIFLSADQQEEFVTALDAPPTDNPALKRLLARAEIFSKP